MLWLQGTIVEGMGKGKFFLSQVGYQLRIEKRVGFVPFPGTMNLKIDSKEWVRAKKRLSKKIIAPFQFQHRSFGGLDLYPCRLPDQSGAAVIVPHQTTHPSDIIEIIAAKNLRKEFGLKNGDFFEALLNEKKRKQKRKMGLGE